MKPNMRIQNELEELMYASSQYCELIKVNNERQWMINVYCEKSSPFHGRPLKVQVDFSQSYPYEPAKLTLKEDMETIFHPNISSSGTICHTVVNSSDPSIRVVDRVEGMIALMECPNPSNPYNGSAAKVYDSNPNEWYRQALMKFRGFKI